MDWHTLTDADMDMLHAYESMDTPVLEHFRYLLGVTARETNFPLTITHLGMVNYLLLARTATTLCEGCLGRYGCDMCCPPSFDYIGYDTANVADDHYEQFGYPAFPNEY